MKHTKTGGIGNTITNNYIAERRTFFVPGIIKEFIDRFGERKYKCADGKTYIADTYDRLLAPQSIQKRPLK